MKLETQDDQLMTISAFRYCLGRRSYMVGTCEEWLRLHWDQLTDHTRRLIREETRNAIDHDMAGDCMDVATWGHLLAWIEKGGPSEQ